LSPSPRPTPRPRPAPSQQGFLPPHPSICNLRKNEGRRIRGPQVA
jgi:hypothetical protein